jgi:hypothetical protein
VPPRSDCPCLNRGGASIIFLSISLNAGSSAFERPHIIARAHCRLQHARLSLDNKRSEESIQQCPGRSMLLAKLFAYLTTLSILYGSR